MHDLHEMHRARDFKKNQKGFNLKGKVESNRAGAAGHVCCMCVLGGMHAGGEGRRGRGFSARAARNKEPIHEQGKEPFARFGSCVLMM